VFLIPPGVTDESAALIQLGIIASQGIALSRLESGERVVVVGAGLVGALALRIAVAGGGVPVAVIARSRQKEGIALGGGAAEFLLSDDGAVDELQADVIIESTGDPAGILVAARAAGPGGRVVLLGSPRGTTRDVPVDTIRRRGLRIIGAHVDTLDLERARTGVDARRREGERFLELLAAGTLEISELAGYAVDPSEAGIFYRRLAEDRSIVGAHFDWSLLADDERCSRGHLLAPPAIGGRGIDAEARPLRPPVPLARSLQLGDPFANATGRLRFGILGCGDIGVHNAAGIGLAPNTEVVACYDPDEALARSLAAPHGASVASSAEALCAHPEVDAVLVCAPHYLHAPLASLAIDAGRHVVVEKPLTSDLAGAVELVDRAGKAGVVLTVCFPQRFQPETMIAHELVRRGLLGTFTGTLIKLYLDKTPSYWSGGFSGRSISDWRRSRQQAGGGVLIMNLSHHIDLVHHLSGVEVEAVSATTDAGDDPDAIESSVTAGLGFTNGATGSVFGGASVRGATAGELRMWGTEGHLALEPSPSAFTLRHMEGLRPGRWQSFGRMPVYNSRAVFMSRVATAISSEQPVDVSAEDGLMVQAVIEAAYRSSTTGLRLRPSDLIVEARR
jgi:predicted dehydrogenase